MSRAKCAKHLRGANADIWGLIYASLDAEEGWGNITMLKVKSHASVSQAYLRGINYQMLVLNEAADEAARVHCDHQGKWAAELAACKAQETGSRASVAGWLPFRRAYGARPTRLSSSKPTSEPL